MRLSACVGFDVAGFVTIRVGKVELGQGILTALAQIAADELDVAFERILMRAVDTSASPDEGGTTGSRSISDSGGALRQVCAEVRATFLGAVADKYGCDAGELVVTDGTIHDASGAVSVSYWQLPHGELLDRDTDGSAKPRVSRAVVGTSPPRIDLPDKVMGRARFIHDLELPGQLFGRVVRPPSRGAVLTRIDDVELPCTVVHDGDFLGVVAEREETAVRAAERLAKAARWEERDSLPTVDDPRGRPADVITVADASPIDVVTEVRASYSRPYLAHASIGPSCGIALWQGNDLSVWTHSQNPFALRRAIAQALDLPESRIVVRHVEGAGCYGHNGADDAAFDAVLLARAVPGRPVQVVWSRADELGWAPLGPAMVVDLAAGLDADGNVVAWHHDVWSQGHTSRPGYGGTPGLLAAGRELIPALDPPLPAGGLTRNADPLYDFPNRRVTGHRVREMPLRTSALRSLGAYLNVFAIESFVDELAARAGADPVAYRLAHLTDERARTVIERVAEAASWGRTSAGRGIGFARYKNSGAYCAVVAEVEAVDQVRVRRLVIAADVGRVVSPDGVRNQLEGGAVQSTSWTLLEAVRFDRRTVTSTGWDTYPILRFSDVPRVHVELVDRPDLPSLGAGEAAQGPTAAAIANAVRDALGVAVRDLPLTREQVIAALDTQVP